MRKLSKWQEALKKYQFLQNDKNKISKEKPYFTGSFVTWRIWGSGKKEISKKEIRPVTRGCLVSHNSETSPG